MIELELLTVFVLASLALNLTPGADMMFVFGQSLGAGRRAGFFAACGVAVGAMGHAVLAAIGVSALLAAHPILLEILRLAGAAYLIWLGVQSFRTTLDPAALSGQKASDRRAFQRGILTNLLNPKVALFVLAFLPQFANPERGDVWLQILVLGAIFAIGGGIVLLFVAFASSTIRQFLVASPQLARLPHWISGLVMWGLAARLLWQTVTEVQAPSPQSH